MCKTRINYKENKPLFIGTLANCLFLFSRAFDRFPHFLSGILIGIAIAGYGIGLYSANHDISSLTRWKNSLFKRR